MNKTKRIVFVIESKRTIRNFISSGALREIAKQFQVEIWHKKDIEAPKVGASTTYPLPNLSRVYLTINNFYHHCLLWRNRERNMMMKTRALNQFGNRNQREKWKSVIDYEIKDWSEFKRRLVRLASYELPLRIIVLLRSLIMQTELIFNRGIKKLNLDFGILLLPYGGALSSYFDFLVFLAQKKKILSFALQENWDNLSTKSFLIEAPDIFGTWGEQSSSHLREFHDIDVPCILELGSPRFDIYFQRETTSMINTQLYSTLKSSSEAKVKESFKYILVTGTGDGIDDEIILKSTISALDEANHGDSLEIVFRPHPATRMQRDFSTIWNISEKILIDFVENDENPMRVSQLVRGSELLVNNFSTLTLEALLSNKPAIVPLFNGIPEAKWRYDRLIDEAPHFIGMKLLSGLYAPKDQEEFVQVLQEIIAQENSPNTKELRRLNWICQEGNYAEKLAAAIVEVLDSDNRFN